MTTMTMSMARLIMMPATSAVTTTLMIVMNMTILQTCVFDDCCRSADNDPSPDHRCARMCFTPSYMAHVCQLASCCSSRRDAYIGPQVVAPIEDVDLDTCQIDVCESDNDGSDVDHDDVGDCAAAVTDGGTAS